MRLAVPALVIATLIASSTPVHAQDPLPRTRRANYNGCESVAWCSDADIGLDIVNHSAPTQPASRVPYAAPRGTVPDDDNRYHVLVEWDSHSRNFVSGYDTGNDTERFCLQADVPFASCDPDLILDVDGIRLRGDGPPYRNSGLAASYQRIDQIKGPHQKDTAKGGDWEWADSRHDKWTHRRKTIIELQWTHLEFDGASTHARPFYAMPWVEGEGSIVGIDLPPNPYTLRNQPFGSAIDACLQQGEQGIQQRLSTDNIVYLCDNNEGCNGPGAGFVAHYDVVCTWLCVNGPCETTAPEANDQWGRIVASGDFDDDGFEDVAVAAPYQDVNGQADAGAVTVLYGSADGLTGRRQVITQDTPGIPGAAEANDNMGLALATGYFNTDDYLDLAIGIPFEDVDGIVDAGYVIIVHGSSDGLDPSNALDRSGSHGFHQDTAGIEGGAEAGDHFGWALATGDFNGDLWDDLAVGVPHEDLQNNTIPDAGAVNVIYGGVWGLSADGNQMWHQNVSGIVGTCEPTDGYGWSLAAGNFDGVGPDDLAVGVPFEDIRGIADAGMVNVIKGSAGVGLVSAGDQSFHQDKSGMEDTVQAFDYFGYNLAVGNFNGDSREDLAIGVPGEEVNFLGLAGAVSVVYGTSSGLSYSGDQIFHQANSGGTAEAFDLFGLTLTAADFDNNGSDDLAVGTPYERMNGLASTGIVNVIYSGSSSSTKLDSASSELWHQGLASIDGSQAADDFFGFGLTAGDYTGDGYADLVTGIPGEDVDGVDMAGGISVIRGHASGLVAAYDQLLTE